jgi:hypothetical protein
MVADLFLQLGYQAQLVAELRSRDAEIQRWTLMAERQQTIEIWYTMA